MSNEKKCDNVLVDKKIKGCPFIDIIIDDSIISVNFRTIRHPMGGFIKICELI